jgi:hypothetical protein
MLVSIMAETEYERGERQMVRRKISRAWLLLLVLPYVGLCFPQFYVRLTPALWGFPFFYWYQFGWVILTSVLLGIFYLKTKSQN